MVPSASGGFSACGLPLIVSAGSGSSGALEIIGKAYEKMKEGYDLICIQKNSVRYQNRKNAFHEFIPI
jgi:dolichol-phosphate mannosyltransferase